ncbi:glycosyltransferase [Nostoc sp. TCL26-01]|uniref:glycosyltransferase n=1 Tax=Nostoc sp. TCL26-01 TaxID=2576904 RepID=UPI0015B83A64|nr:glycosyltransferase [Nostoc sp. TCL26-01]QLE56152.1 glycosyltransferase family 4 protein [Nostoc sp. TCL26-01]
MAQQVIDSTNNNHLTAPKQKRYRVVLLHPSAGVNWSGGSEIFAIELARRLSGYFDVELLSGAPCGDFSQPSGGIPRTHAFEFVRNPLISGFVHKFMSHPEIVIEHVSNFLPCTIRLLTKPVDLIFPCNDYGGMAVGAVVRFFKGTPILFTEHVGLMGGGKSLSRNLRFHPNQLVVFSEKIAAFARNLAPQQNIVIIPNGVDVDKFTPIGNQIDFGLPKPVVLCVASLKRNSHKRIELAMQAIAKLPHASLLLCGDGIDRDYFQAKGDELLGKQRFQIQSFPYERMPEVYRSADVFTLPSIDEPFGLAYVEAMASGLPVVATDDEMRREIVADAGMVCDVTNLEIYAQALEQVLNQDLKMRSRQNALRFSWEAIALKYRDLILATIEKQR